MGHDYTNVRKNSIGPGDIAGADGTTPNENAMSGPIDSLLYGPGSGITLSGSPTTLAGTLQGLQFGQMLYGQGIGDVGKEASSYSNMVQGRLGTNYAGADVQRQIGNAALAKNQAQMGLNGTNNFTAQEQMRRQGSAQSATMNQDYKDKALALYGRNISAKQQGLAGQYMAGAGIGQANTPSAVPNYSSGTFGCLALVSVGLMSKETHASELPFINSNSYEYIGYCLIVTPFIPLILRNGKFAKFFSFMAHKYVLNLTGAKKTILGKLIKLIGGSFCSVIGKLC